MLCKIRKRDCRSRFAGEEMKIEFTKEDIEQIRRIIRQEISRFWYGAMDDLNKKIISQTLFSKHLRY